MYVKLFDDNLNLWHLALFFKSWCCKPQDIFLSVRFKETICFSGNQINREHAAKPRVTHSTVTRSRVKQETMLNKQQTPSCSCSIQSVSYTLQLTGFDFCTLPISARLKARHERYTTIDLADPAASQANHRAALFWA